MTDEITPEKIDSNGPDHMVTEQGQHQWDAVHLYDSGDLHVSVARRFVLFHNNDGGGYLRQLTTYNDGDGVKHNRSETTWDVTTDGETPPKHTVEHSGETVAEFVESVHYVDPHLDIERAIEETTN